jgi:hypothetical protein
MNITADLIAAAASILLSLALNYIPGLNTKFAELSSEIKSLIVAISIIVIGILVALSSCGNLWVFISCDKVGLMKIGECILFALVANQGAYKLSPQTKAVKNAKSLR